ncbi:biotin-dependent carboxyltransferase family protein [Volucribacter amazonae]|uniref:Carboxyltransferase domain-containing protein n=1 Tax=Volucribacter amazonae TaxID=256731 RepID=A0A9X4PP56_9PAST|nr:biotin-dependent carboxyltransferase family protein [Volucribacter amazonae]MDG6895238.1 hypothetical protein [Volucribacter amazonae]
MIYIQYIQSFAHLQDLGRFGSRGLGVGSVGAMDPLALQTGNLLLNNDPNDTAIEIALGRLAITFDCDTPFCLTGALFEAELDGKPIFPYWRYTARARQTLHLKRAVVGNYAYLCVAGGFAVPEVLASRSTDLKAGFGGFHGRLLRAGDHIATGKRDCYLHSVGIEPIAFTNKIFAIASSEYDHFTPESQQAFWQTPWRLQSNSSRMGYRLQGQTLVLNDPLEMLSHGVPVGTVQVPPEGQPIVLMADAQTTGGYPKIATVIRADLGRLAQNPFGQDIYFRQVSVEQALAQQQKNQQYLDYVRRMANETR